MATSAVKFVFSATDNTSTASKSAQRNLRSIGEEASKAAAGILSIEKARIGLEAIRSVSRVVSDSFAMMAKNSAAMKGELGAVSTAMGKVSGALGDSIANSQTFKSLMDTTINAMKDFEGWIESNGKTIEEVFAGAVRYSAQATRALLLTVKGLIDLIIVAKNLVPASQESASSLVEGTAWSMRFLGLKARQAITGESTVQRQAEAARMALRAYGAGEGQIGQALDRSQTEVDKLNEMLDSADALLARVAKGEGTGGGDRATRLGGGKAGAGPAAAQAEQQKALLASQAAFERDMITMRAEATNDRNDLAAEALRAEQDAAAATLRVQAQALEAQRRLDDERIAEAKRTAAETAAVLGSLAASTATALAVSLGSGASMIEALFGQIGGAMVQLGGTMTASGFAALLAGPAAALFGLPAPGLIAGGLALSAAGAALQAGLIGGGGGGGGGRGSTVAGASSAAYGGQQRVATTATTEPVVYEIHQYFQGVYTSEAEAGRKIQDAISSSQRSGTSAALSRGRL